MTSYLIDSRYMRVLSLNLVHICIFLLGKRLSGGAEPPLLPCDDCRSTCRASSQAIFQPFELWALSIPAALRILPSDSFLVLCLLRCLVTQRKRKGWSGDHPGTSFLL